jgi:bifunctional non-homologous end joining protein LigD
MTITHRDLMQLSSAAMPFPARAGWVSELKYDGFRTLAIHEGEAIRLLSRRGNNLISSFPEIARCLKQ